MTTIRELSINVDLDWQEFVCINHALTEVITAPFQEVDTPDARQINSMRAATIALKEKLANILQRKCYENKN